MVLLQLLSADKKKKKLLSVDKDALFGDVHDQIASKLEIPRLDGYVVSQIDDRDGDPVEDLLSDTKLSSLPRIGAGIYLWVREADEDTPPESIVGATQSEKRDDASSREEAQPADNEVGPGGDGGAEEEADEEGGEEEPMFSMPENKEGKKKKAPPPRAAPAPSPAPANEEPEQTQEMVPTPERHQLKSALSTEAYEVDYGKYRDFSKTVIKDSSYPIKYANVRRKAPRVTTLSSDNSDNKAPDCLRESYDWTAVGRYKAMVDPTGKVGKSRQGTFKDVSTFPRFASDTLEKQLKDLFAEQMRMREKQQVQRLPRQEREKESNKALLEALVSDEMRPAR